MESTVLEEEYDESYEPTQEEINEYAQFLGMDIEADKDLLWVARQGLKAPLPENWKPCQTQDNQIYYFNFKSGESIWDHPCDETYRQLYRSEKEKLLQSHTTREPSTQSIIGSYASPVDAVSRSATADVKPLVTTLNEIEESPLGSERSAAPPSNAQKKSSYIKTNSKFSVKFSSSASESPAGSSPGQVQKPTLVKEESVSDVSSLEPSVVEVVQPKTDGKDRMSQLLMDKIEQLKQQTEAQQKLQAETQQQLKQQSEAQPLQKQQEEAEQQQQQKQHESQLDKLRKQLEEEYQLFEQKERNELESKRDKLTKQLTQQFEQDEKREHERFQQNLERVRSELEQKEVTEREKLLQESKRRISSVKSGLDLEYEKALSLGKENAVSNQLKVAREQEEDQLKKIQSEYNDKRSKMLQDFSDTERRELQEFETHMQEKKEQLQAARQKLVQEHEVHLRELQAKFSERQQQIEKDFEERIESVRKRYESELHQYEKEYDSIQSRRTQLNESTMKDDAHMNQRKAELERVLRENEEALAEQQRKREELEKEKLKLRQEEESLRLSSYETKLSRRNYAPIFMDGTLPGNQQQPVNDENRDLSNEVDERLRREEQELQRAKLVLERQKLEMLGRQQTIAAETWKFEPNVVNNTGAAYGLPGAQPMPPMAQSFNASPTQTIDAALARSRRIPSVSDRDPADRYNSLDNLQNELGSVLSHLREYHRTIEAPTIISPTRSANYMRFNQKLEPGGTYVLQPMPLNPNPPMIPRTAPAVRDWEAHRQRSDHILRDHTLWLKSFRQQMGLGRTGAAYSIK